MKENIKVLIVDDEAHNVKIMQEMLSFHPEYECKTARSGEEALGVLESYFPEIILLDIVMKGIDGIEVCKKIRSIREHRFSKIIMVSGMSMIDDRLKGYEAGADDYLTKPFVEEELLAKLKVYSKLNRMEEVDTLKTTAMNILTHEVRTPLNGIILASELLGELDTIPEKARRYVEMVRESGLRIQELVEKISRYFTIKDGIEKKLSVDHLNPVINNIIKVLCGSAGEGGPVVTCDCAKTLSFTADWELLREAFLYLIDNAIKNTPHLGVVNIVCWKKQTQVFVQITDQGHPVDPVLAKRIFDGLFSTDVLHHRKGTGLSLAITKEIISEHGGHISCRNRKNGGTVFEVVLEDQDCS